MGTVVSLLAGFIFIGLGVSVGPGTVKWYRSVAGLLGVIVAVFDCWFAFGALSSLFLVLLLVLELGVSFFFWVYLSFFFGVSSLFLCRSSSFRSFVLLFVLVVFFVLFVGVSFSGPFSVSVLPLFFVLFVGVSFSIL